MSMKTFIWGGMFVGSGLGGLLPVLWGGSAFSLSAVLLTFAGGALGVWAGYLVGKSLS